MGNASYLSRLAHTEILTNSHKISQLQSIIAACVAAGKQTNPGKKPASRKYTKAKSESLNDTRIVETGYHAPVQLSIIRWAPLIHSPEFPNRPAFDRSSIWTYCG